MTSLFVVFLFFIAVSIADGSKGALISSGKENIEEQFDSLFGSSRSISEKGLNPVDLTSAVASTSSNSLPSFEALFTAGSFADVLQVTSAPTFTPTEKPSALATGYNSQFDNSMQLNGVITVNNADGSTWQANSDQTVKNTLGTILGGSTDTISDGKVIQTLQGRRKLLTEYNTTFVISYLLYFDMARYPDYQGNTTALYLAVTRIISQAVADGTFQDLVRSAASADGVNQLVQAKVPVVKFENYLYYLTSRPPTVRPTNLPSSSPSSAPTMAPSMSDFSYYLQFNGFFGIFNVSGNTIKSGGQQSLLETITDVTDVGNTHLLYSGITNQVPSGGTSIGGRKLSAKNLWDMVVQVQFTVPLSDFSQFKGNGTKLFNYLKSLLNESVVEDIFDDLLHKNTLIYQGTELSFAEVKSVRFSNFVLLKDLQSPTSLPTSQPSMQPTSNPTISTPPDTLEFEAFWGLGNLTSISFPSAAQNVLIDGMSDVMDISESHIQFVAITDSLRRKLNIRHELVVATKVTIPLDEFPELNGNATKLYFYITTLLMEAKNDGVMQKLLRQGARKGELEDIFWVTVNELRFVDFRLLRPTRSPTAEPTAQPSPTFAPFGSNIGSTRTPTAAPTASSNSGSNAPTNDNSGQSLAPTNSNAELSFAPTSNQNDQPTVGSSPTNNPVDAPTAPPAGNEEPNSAPTSPPNSVEGQPTFEPTAKPNVVTNSPTAQTGNNPAPTGVPLPEPVPVVIVQYKAIFTIGNVLSTTTSIDGETSLLETISDIQNAKRGLFEFLGIRNVVNRARRLDDLHTLTLATRLSFNSADFPELNGNGTAIYATTTQKLNNAVSSGQFDALLQSNGADTELRQAKVLGLAFEDQNIINPIINSNGDQQLPLATADLAAIVSGAIVGFGLLVFLAYIGFTRCRGDSDMILKKGSKSSSSQYSEEMKESIDSDNITLEEIYWDSQEHNEVIVLNIMKDYGIEEDSMMSRIVELPVVNTTTDTRI